MAVVSDGSYRVPEGLISRFRSPQGGNWTIVSGRDRRVLPAARIDKSTAELADEARSHQLGLI